MGVYDFGGNSGSNSKSWNYSDNTKPNYMEQITGVVVEISAPQSLEFGSKKPLFWGADNKPTTMNTGNLIHNICLSILCQDGIERDWVFSPKSKAMDACAQVMPGATDIKPILGHLITVTTQAGNYRTGNPRPFWVQDHGMADQQTATLVRGVKDPEEAQQTQPAMQTQQPMMQQQPMAQSMQQMQPQQPVMQQQAQPMVTNNPVMQQAMQPQPMTQQADAAPWDQVPMDAYNM